MSLVIWSQTGYPHMEYLDHVRRLCTQFDTVAIASGTILIKWMNGAPPSFFSVSMMGQPLTFNSDALWCHPSSGAVGTTPRATKQSGGAHIAIGSHLEERNDSVFVKSLSSKSLASVERSAPSDMMVAWADLMVAYARMDHLDTPSIVVYPSQHPFQQGIDGTHNFQMSKGFWSGQVECR